jgi:hypothetical protein
LKAATALKVIAAALAGFAVVYLVGAFQQASFDIQAWSADARFMVALVGSLVGVMSAAASVGAA